MSFINNIIDAIPNVSIVTKIEVLGFNAPDKHYQLLINFMNDSVVLELTGSVVDICIDIRKKYKTKLPDAIIASTALAHGCILISRNISDFKNIDGLQVIDPYNLSF
jgi:predicted nucleic acid-binding protein